jgi:hypothetical protein
MQLARQYLECLKTHRRDAEACRQLSQQYLECRMERCAWWHSQPTTGSHWQLPPAAARAAACPHMAPICSIPGPFQLSLCLWLHNNDCHVYASSKGGGGSGTC